MTLEKLLNILLERGWKPRGYNDIKKITVENNKNVKQKVIHLRPEIGVDIETLTRFICVKESGLWQFCVENGMVKMAEGFYWQNIFLLDSIEYEYVDYQYWIIESALKDESELEEFLLQNIKVEG